jgi:hypothetical protein
MLCGCADDVPASAVLRSVSSMSAEKVRLNGSKIFYAYFRIGVPDHSTLAASHPVFGEDEPKFLWQQSCGWHHDLGTALRNVNNGAATQLRAITDVDPSWELHLFPN